MIRKQRIHDQNTKNSWSEYKEYMHDQKTEIIIKNKYYMISKQLADEEKTEYV